MDTLASIGDDHTEACPYMRPSQPIPRYAESLKMLESEEGQLNAVFACYGSAMQHGQLYEQAVDKLLGTYLCLTVSDQSESEASTKQRKNKKQTLGQLLRSLFNGVTINDEDVHKLLMEALDKRNMLAHEYFITRSPLFFAVDGRLKLIRELVNIEQTMRTAMSLINGMKIAIEESLSGERGDINESEVLFTMGIEIENR